MNITNFNVSKLNDNYINLKAKYDRINNKWEMLGKKRDEIAKEIYYYEKFIADCSDSPDELNVNNHDLINAMVEIAGIDGFFDTYEHKDMLVENGIVKGDSRAISQKIYQTLDESEKFEPNGKKGRWNLIMNPPTPFVSNVADNADNDIPF